MNFQFLIADRLEKIRNHLQEEPYVVAEQMMQGRFERIKCSYGTPSSFAIPTIPLPVPGLAPDQNFPHVNIEGSSMILSRYEGRDDVLRSAADHG